MPETTAHAATTKKRPGLLGRLTSSHTGTAMVAAMVLLTTLVGAGIFKPGVSQAYYSKPDYWGGGLYAAGCPSGPSPYMQMPITIRQGSRNGCVAVMQRFLNKFNTVRSTPYTSQVNTPLGEHQLAQDGVFGPATAREVGDFQDYMRFWGTPLARDGVVGPNTWAAVYNCMDTTLAVNCHRGMWPGQY